MKKKLPVIIGIICTIAFSVWFGFTDKTHKIYDNNVNTATYASLGAFLPEWSLTQDFLCEEDTINALLIKSDRAGDFENAVVRLTVTDKETGEILSEGTEEGRKIKARQLHKYPIQPISGYRGKMLSVTVTEENSGEGNGIAIYYQPAAAGEDRQFILNNNPVSGSLVLKTVTERFDAETFIIMLVSLWFIWGFLWFLYRLFK